MMVVSTAWDDPPLIPPPAWVAELPTTVEPITVRYAGIQIVCPPRLMIASPMFAMPPPLPELPLAVFPLTVLFVIVSVGDVVDSGMFKMPPPLLIE